MKQTTLLYINDIMMSSAVGLHFGIITVMDMWKLAIAPYAGISNAIENLKITEQLQQLIISYPACRVLVTDVPVPYTMRTDRDHFRLLAFQFQQVTHIFLETLLSALQSV